MIRNLLGCTQPPVSSSNPVGSNSLAGRGAAGGARVPSPAGGAARGPGRGAPSAARQSAPPDLADIDNWGPTQVCEFLQGPAVGLRNIPPKFVARDPTGPFLKSLELEDLKEFNFLTAE